MSILHQFRDHIIAYFAKFEEVTWPQPCPPGGRLSSQDY